MHDAQQKNTVLVRKDRLFKKHLVVNYKTYFII